MSDLPSFNAVTVSYFIFLPEKLGGRRVLFCENMSGSHRNRLHKNEFLQSSPPPPELYGKSLRGAKNCEDC